MKSQLSEALSTLWTDKGLTCKLDGSRATQASESGERERESRKQHIEDGGSRLRSESGTDMSMA